MWQLELHYNRTGFNRKIPAIFRKRTGVIKMVNAAQRQNVTSENSLFADARHDCHLR